MAKFHDIAQVSPKFENLLPQSPEELELLSCAIVGGSSLISRFPFHNAKSWKYTDSIIHILSIGCKL